MLYEVPLYQRQFRFAGMAEGAFAFLHDHRREEHRIERCWLTLSLRASVSFGPRTDLDAWRRLFNVLAHERKNLKAVGVEVGGEFWDLTPWEFPDGVEAVFEKHGLLQPFGEAAEHQTPFEHFSRLLPSVKLSLHVSHYHFTRKKGLEDNGKKLIATNRSTTTDHETCKGRILSPT
ncbi:hypothetical protein EJ03DRAFT_217021 [Teratosphaeria nubilosa]|uniref:Uncharacterized protein n=1 Tax=Teratosphaeria nubilosa TaxID=161662 RepID=A0A6G1LHY3_9PEZI|nr:hypothetical protein EJ03DRAFT_217021 [Teratosphaeria nubilosa]